MEREAQGLTVELYKMHSKWRLFCVFVVVLITGVLGFFLNSVSESFKRTWTAK